MGRIPQMAHHRANAVAVPMMRTARIAIPRKSRIRPAAAAADVVDIAAAMVEISATIFPAVVVVVVVVVVIVIFIVVEDVEAKMMTMTIASSSLLLLPTRWPRLRRWRMRRRAGRRRHRRAAADARVRMPAAAPATTTAPGDRIRHGGVPAAAAISGVSPVAVRSWWGHGHNILFRTECVIMT
jgi:hypothetical protein